MAPKPAKRRQRALEAGSEGIGQVCNPLLQTAGRHVGFVLAPCICKKNADREIWQAHGGINRCEFGITCMGAVHQRRRLLIASVQQQKALGGKDLYLSVVIGRERDPYLSREIYESCTAGGSVHALWLHSKATNAAKVCKIWLVCRARAMGCCRYPFIAAI